MADDFSIDDRGLLTGDRFNPFDIRKLLHAGSGVNCARFTQDSPFMPDVWRHYVYRERVDLLLTPYFGTPASVLADAVRSRLQEAEVDLGPVQLASNDSHVVGRFTLCELLVLLPLVKGWHERLSRWPGPARAALKMDELFSHGARRLTLDEVQLYWFAQAAGLLLLLRELRSASGESAGEASFLLTAEEFDIAIDQVPLLRPGLPSQLPAALARVSVNRVASQSCTRSTLTVKADAARLLFNIRTDRLAWGIIDSGVDHNHPAFADHEARGKNRIVQRLDFSRLRRLLAENGESFSQVDGNGSARSPLVFGRDQRKLAADWQRIQREVRSGKILDWPRLIPFLVYESRPTDPHGTHVAGILGGDYRPGNAGQAGDEAFCGMCPQIRIYDLRAFDDDGHSDEFTILCALQYVRYLNTQGAQPLIHGVNLSFSLRHEVTAFACGATPVCEECDRLVSAGTVVVAAAGNAGFDKTSERYNDVSLTDPGNAESVITVGSTHRTSPHSYGVSYFSSRGPTADGRAKPDLVAPGEKIVSACPVSDAGGATLTQDGTSMAAPHVSGAAALLMARNPELIGKPARIKQVLCQTATDLGRTRDFQGCGLLDVLRALQSV